MTKASRILIFSLMYRMDDTPSTIYLFFFKETNDELFMTIDDSSSATLKSTQLEGL